MTSLMTAPPTVRPDERAARRTAAMLQAGVPLTLLMDLVRPDGPHSRELYLQERS